MNSAVRVKASRPRAAAFFFHVLYITQHQKVWPRFQIGLLISKDSDLEWASSLQIFKNSSQVYLATWILAISTSCQVDNPWRIVITRPKTPHQRIVFPNALDPQDNNYGYEVQLTSGQSCWGDFMGVVSGIAGRYNLTVNSISSVSIFPPPFLQCYLVVGCNIVLFLRVPLFRWETM